ncbi:MAG: quinolinate synthase NadA [Deltaproteobacteria bacterium]|nr:quinolinate synthase NadA [Deltaproteobacteria bacterium]
MPSFPSLTIRADALLPRGSFAESQAAFLRPDDDVVRRLQDLFSRHGVGVVAHFYMDPELQGVLASCDPKHVQISDSLVMADAAVKMANAGMKAIVVLGVDFMAENVRAMLDVAGHTHVPVYRVAAGPIGCSLAEAARSPAYAAYLHQASETPRSLHVVYINTSLDVKARAHDVVPTITCTSSNVVQTILQTFAQIPDVHVWFGPDTYMGQNIEELLRGVTELDDATARALHPAHDRASIRSALLHFHHFGQGACIVHHLFGDAVVRQVEREYADAFVTAHFEVPGEMFRLALRAQREGRGVVGSTSNILGFIHDRVRTRIAAPTEHPRPLRFILGTEAGMITSIVRDVQRTLAEAGAADLEVEIVFPVANEAVAQTDDAELRIVPGVAGGEGCSTAGGCATCPFMKMNSLDALLEVLAEHERQEARIARFHPRIYAERIAGRTVADLGSEPILHMRHFGRSGALSDALVADVVGRRGAA